MGCSDQALFWVYSSVWRVTSVGGHVSVMSGWQWSRSLGGGLRVISSLSQPLPPLSLLFCLSVKLHVVNLGGLCLSIAFVWVMNFVRCLIPALFQLIFQGWHFSPCPEGGIGWSGNPWGCEVSLLWPAQVGVEVGCGGTPLGNNWVSSVCKCGSGAKVASSMTVLAHQFPPPLLSGCESGWRGKMRCTRFLGVEDNF